jgi:PPK2 family polyphosphate:nucleotide phosphotransferase
MLAGRPAARPGAGDPSPEDAEQEVAPVVEVTDERKRNIARLIDPLRVEPGRAVDLGRDFDPGDRSDLLRKKDGRELLATGIELLAEYQRRLAAQSTHGVLLCLQSLDAGGKDGTIRHVMSGVNPQGVHVSSFKVPSTAELGHDYLWRYARALPARGEIGIFNRSHYEEVLVVRVHPEALARQGLPAAGADAVGEDLWARRYREINAWERYLVDNGFAVVKLFLNLSWEEQRARFLERVRVPERNWKFSPADVRERARWDDYQLAFSQMLAATSTAHAPWYVVPADHKWFARICAAAVLAHTLIGIDPQYPVVGEEVRRELAAVGRRLEAECATRHGHRDGHHDGDANGRDTRTTTKATQAGR